jgi:hypothetical protein
MANEPTVTRRSVSPTFVVVRPRSHLRATMHEMMIRLGQTR